MTTDLRHTNTAHPRTTAQRTGFTLVEMLVAVALVLLMMTMFATVFQIATGSMSKQKGLAENDQKARRATITIRSDMDKRTFRKVFPLQTGTAPRWPASQQGYLSISENDPTDDTDDVLCFTIITSNTLKNKDVTPIYGRSTLLTGNSYSQPEYDDGQIQANDSTLSTIAEVCYFLRNGVLYRRVMLVRSPYVGTDSQPRQWVPATAPATGNVEVLLFGSASPQYSSYSTTVAPNGSNVFYRDLDFSAYNMGGYGLGQTYPQFLGIAPYDVNALSNSYNTSAPAGTLIPQLGMPNVRFGHNVLLTGAKAGLPCEYINNGTEFIGRFTHEETSHDAFTYPGQWSAITYPMTDTSLKLGADGVVNNFRGGPRRGEDLLLTNVHAFDIKVFDNHRDVMDYRDLGYAAKASDPNNKPGFYWRGACRTPKYGPRNPGPGADGQPGEAGVDDDGNGTTDDATELGWAGSDDVANNVFDTWHPNFLVDLDGDTTWDQCPYSPDVRGPDLQPGRATVDDDGNLTVDDASELGWPGTDDFTPLQSIQIRLRYLDPVSNQMRDVTIIQSLVD